MDPGLILILSLLGVSGAVGGYFLLKAKKNADTKAKEAKEAAAIEEAKWINLPAASIRYQGNVDPNRLIQAVADARNFLATVPGWSKAMVDSRTDNVGIKVQPSEPWNSASGLVYGLSNLDANNIEVGPSLAALVHEFAHMIEYRQFGKTDYTHKSWETNGIYDAINQYDLKWPV